VGTRLRGHGAFGTNLHRTRLKMRALSAHEIIEVWETGEDQHVVDRALTLLEAACPERTREELAALSVGQRDASLLSLRERTFGPRLNGFIECPRCSERLEFEVAVSELRVAAPEVREAEQELLTGDLVLRFRLPDSRDLAAALDRPDVDAARRTLVQRCVLFASCDGVSVGYSELPAEAITELAGRMAEWDPQAEVLLDLRCLECGNVWHALFDIAVFLWGELTARARRLLDEINSLARAYGWRESDILSLSARRRRYYLELANA
jgi:hypothetical protein